MEKVYQELLDKSKKASLNTYSPYSNFPVGACVLYESGNKYVGCNVENVSYGLTLCAERNAISTAIANGITRCIVPSGNLDEALEVEGALVYGAETLRDAFDALGNVNVFKEKKVNVDNKDEVEFADLGKAFLFEDIKGQYKLIRGLQIAAAGGHNFLALGAPGCGKTMAIQKFPGINPLLTMDDAQSVTRIWSLAGLIKPNEPLIRVPPFRMPHQTATIDLFVIVA